MRRTDEQQDHRTAPVAGEQAHHGAQDDPAPIERDSARAA
jgi:hypothetical protein